MPLLRLLRDNWAAVVLQLCYSAWCGGGPKGRRGLRPGLCTCRLHVLLPPSDPLPLLSCLPSSQCRASCAFYSYTSWVPSKQRALVVMPTRTSQGLLLASIPFCLAGYLAAGWALDRGVRCIRSSNLVVTVGSAVGGWLPHARGNQWEPSGAAGCNPAALTAAATMPPPAAATFARRLWRVLRVLCV